MIRGAELLQYRASSAGLGLLTPAMVYYDDGGALVTDRRAMLMGAYAAHSGRLISKPPTLRALPVAVWISSPGPTVLTMEARRQCARPVSDRA
jgi:hypothetical protein